MSKQQRERTLRSAGKRPLGRSAAKTGVDLPSSKHTSSDRCADVSCNQTVASNSENSAHEERQTDRCLAGYGWYQEYVELSQRFAWRLAAYIAWAASPVKGRAPATQLELAQALGLKTDRTIRQWKEKDPTIDQVIAQLQAAPLWWHRRDLYEALVKAATDGDVPALKLALEMTGDYVPRMKQTVDNTIKPGSYTADDLAAAERELGEWEAGRQEDRGQKVEGRR